MTDNFLDRSNYFKGLLLLVGKDQKVSEAEKDMIFTVGKTLGFEKSFFEGAVKDLLENEYIDQNPPVFSQKSYAEAFLRDGIKLAFVDNDLDGQEFDWLHSVAEKNGIPNEWLKAEFHSFINHRNITGEPELEIQKFFNINKN
ncbi:MAG: hypothetical protein ACEPO8_06580 [Rhodothermaceae bacterium]